MNFNQMWMYGLASLLVMWCVSTSAEDAKSDKPKNPAAAVKNEESSKQPASPRTAPLKSLPKVDPFAVPVGAKPARLIAFIEELIYQRPPVLNSPEEITAYNDKRTGAVLLATQQVLDVKDVEVELAARALKSRFLALSMKTRMGDKTAIKQRLELAQKYRQDSRQPLVKIAIDQGLYAKLQQFDKLSAKEQEQLLEESVAYVRSADALDQALLTRISTIGNIFEGAKSEGLSARAYDQFAELMKQSAVPEMWQLSRQFGQMAGRMRLVGKQLELAGQLSTQQPLDWAAYRGKVVLVDFWATTSVRCLTELPNLKSLYRGYSSKGFDIIGVSVDKNKIALDKYLSKNQISWSNLFNFDEDAEDHPVAMQYGILSVPYRILVGKDGKVIKLNPTNSELRQALTELLGPPVEIENKAADKPAEK